MGPHKTLPAITEHSAMRGTFEQHAESGAAEDEGPARRAGQGPHRSFELLPGGRQKHAVRKLSIEGAVQVLLGDQDVYPVVLPQTAEEAAGGHRVPTAEEPDGHDPSLLYLSSGRIDWSWIGDINGARGRTLTRPVSIRLILAGDTSSR
jgi:hypothetical protein